MEDFNWTSFIIWTLVFWVGLRVLTKWLEAKNKIMEAEIETLQKAVNEKFIHVSVEKHGDIFYLFNKETGQFVAQGKNMEELKLHCDQRFKNNVIIGNEEELKTAGLL